ncbi:MAG: tellurium resistance protein TerC [Planctomycetota bacterium]
MDLNIWHIFSVQGITTLAMLVLLQAVLGFDNLLYISIESKRAPEDKQQQVRRLGIILALILRVVLLFIIMSAIKYVSEPFFNIRIDSPFAAATEEIPAASVAGDTTDREWKVGYQERGEALLSGEFTLHSIITLFGGVFILYTAVKEVLHLLAVDHIENTSETKPKSAGAVIAMIVIMNLVFSFDSILSAMALTKNFWVMATAIVISGALMLYLADTVAEFLKKNRMYEVLGLFILFIVGVMLIGEGGHLAHLQLFTYHVEPMAKSTFYFTIAILVVIDVVQSRYRKKLLAQRERELHAGS